MAAVVASSSSISHLTWSQALVLLESPSPNGVPPSAATFLRSHLDQLQRPHDPFPPSHQSKTQLSSGSLTVASRQLDVSKPDQQLALDVATRFSCDELEAYHALRHARRAKGTHPDKLAEDEWDRITAWLFEERMAVLAVVALLLRSYDDPAHACYELALELVPEIVTPSFTSSLLAAFTRRTSQHLPDAVRPSRTHSAFWTKQLVREQKTLLELVFLAYYSPRPADGLELARVLEAIQATEFGQRQELFGHFDAEAQGVVREIGDLLTVVALEACNLEQAMEAEYPIGAPGEAVVDPSSVYHPSNLVKVTELVEALAGAARASPILLAWAFLLSKVTASLLERGVPEAYHDFAEQSLRVEAPSSSSRSSTQPLFQLYAAHALSPASAFFPVLLSILRSPLLGHSAQRESFSAAANHEPNAIGYLSVLRGLVTAIPNLVRLPYLSSTQLSALYDAYAALYGNASSAVLCAQFWNDQAVLNAALDGADDDESSMLVERTAQSAGENDIVDLARSRFPLQFGGLTQLVRALCAGAAGLVPTEHPGGGSPAASSDDELLAARCAQSTFAYLATLPSLTHVVPSASVPGVGAAAPLPYEVAAYPDPDTGYAYRATRPIGVSRSVAIPVGAQGRLVSQQGTKPVVVAWDVEWSAWRLFADVLEDYAGVKGRAGAGGGAGARRDVFGSKEAQTDGLPMEWDSEDEHDRDVTAVLDILRITLHSDHSLAVALIDHLATAPGRLAESADPASARNSFVEVLFRILERSLAPNLDRPPPTALVSSLLGLIAALLPSFPGVIWTYLRGSALLFPSTKASSNSASEFGYGAGAAGLASSSSSSVRPQVLHAERLSGQYPVTLALLSLVHALVLEEQVAACVTRSDFRETKHGVLVRALAWVRDTVWLSFSAWRFASLVEKYELARRCTSVFKLVLEESAVAASTASSSSSQVVQVVTDAFVGPKATVAQLSPVLSTLASGPDAILLLRKASRFADAQALEDLVRSSLNLVLGLLRLRRRTKGTSSSLLEKLCLSPAGSASYAVTAGSAHGFAAELDGGSSEGRPARRPELLESLVRFVVAPLDGALAVQAARIVALLCLSTAASETAPASMTALFGGSEGLERLLTALLAVVEDHLAAQEVQVAIWDLLSAIVDSQPGLGMLLVTGRSSPFSIDDLVPAPPKDDKGKARELNDAEKAAQELAKSLAPSAPKPLSRTAVGVALSTLGTWSSIWSERPALLASVLRFFDFAWQHLVEYGPALDDFRARTSTWEAFVKIACENPGSEPHDEVGVVEYCHRVTARAHAARILALDVQAALAKPKAEDAPSVKAFFAAFRDPAQVAAALTSAMASSCAPELHQGIYELVHATFPGLDLDALRNAPSTHPLDEAREFGSEYLYALALVRRRLDGFVADADSAVDGDALADVVAQTAQLNRNFSLLEAQILDTRSWRQLLETVSPLVRKETATPSTSAVGLVAEEIARETRGGQIMTTVQAERLSILLTLVQALGTVEPAKAKAPLVELVVNLAAMFASETLQPLESVAGRETPPVHVALFRATFLAFRQLEVCVPTAEAATKALEDEQRARVAAATEAILRDVLTATRDLLVLARARKDVDIEQDIALAVAVVSQVLKSAFAPPAAVWLAHVHALDLFRCAFDVFVHMDQLEPGQPLYAQHVLDLCLAIATSSPRAAEQLPLEGAMTALTNNALTAAAEAGAIALVSPTDASRTPQHELWTSMLALVVALVAALGESTRFVEQDVTGFVRLYGQQVVRALSWTSSTPVTAAGLEELSAVVALMHGIARSSTTLGVSPSSPVVAVASVFVEQSLHLLQHLVYALLHPNHLAALVEGLTPAERGYLEKEAAEQDVDKRPVAQAVTLKVVQLARDLVGALVEFADAWSTLLKDPMDWRSERAVVLPTATVTAGDKASLGTLFDLSTFCIDALRSPPTTSPAPSLPSSSPFPSLPPASQPVLRAACAETLEACLLLSATQLALHAQQQGGASRALHELGGEVVELVDKAVALSGPGSAKDDERNRKALLEVVRRKLGTWV
ncbi:uncharacterized protein RHOBADRAFT_52251 [Rhodotorula graminis WP1]|uniref:Nucleoporin NUP188 n=1 Tax=Rhodotorula graminis (strain WP1) TaxID=578459 RepID=A0A194S6J1_RHOGW|nr:uncharacterized protein RHOBADRAFT_52251 [Rhodotorula graminis WP1]KPV76212.1 hypothetical protein RHOBADRAFT_52251 [Rhodotorula graminis WP1]